MKKTLCLLSIALTIGVIFVMTRKKEQLSEDSSQPSPSAREILESNLLASETSNVNSKSVDEQREQSKEVAALTDRLKQATSDEELIKVFMEALNKNEDVALHALKDLNCGELNCVALEEPFVNFYIESDRPFDGLEAFSVIARNLDFSSQTFGKIMKASGEKDLEKAFSWSLENKDNEGLAYGFDELGALYAKSENPGEKTKDLMATEMNVYTKASFLDGLLVGWVDKSPTDALEHFATIPQNDSLDWVLLHKMEKITEIDPVAALEWAEYMLDDDFRESTIYEINKKWQTDNPETYKEWQEQNASSLK